MNQTFLSKIDALIVESSKLPYNKLEEADELRDSALFIIGQLFGNGEIPQSAKIKELDFRHIFWGETENKKIEAWEKDKSKLIKLLSQVKENAKLLAKSKSDRPQESTSGDELPIVAILTAIKEEFDAIKSHLTSFSSINKNDTIYKTGIFKYKRKKIAKIIIRECGPTNVIAVQETEKMINNFSPQIILFVGIAGSRKHNDFKIGDVIYPTKIYSYEGGKAELKDFNARPQVYTTSYCLEEIAKDERNRQDWKSLIKNIDNKNKENISANLGIIASGEKLVEHYNSNIGKILAEHYNDTSAVEMEGFGFASAAHRQGKNADQMLIGVVRGISDLIKPTKKKKQDESNDLQTTKEKEKDARPIGNKIIASNSAAAFAFWLVYKALKQD